VKKKVIRRGFDCDRMQPEIHTGQGEGKKRGEDLDKEKGAGTRRQFGIYRITNRPCLTIEISEETGRRDDKKGNEEERQIEKGESKRS